jgi:hypothetical protein
MIDAERPKKHIATIKMLVDFLYLKKQYSEAISWCKKGLHDIKEGYLGSKREFLDTIVHCLLHLNAPKEALEYVYLLEQVIPSCLIPQMLSN